VRSVLGLRLDKSQQQSNWGERPLTAAQVQYAALDAHVLLQLVERVAAWHPWARLPASWVQPLHCRANTTAHVLEALEAAGVSGWSLVRQAPDHPAASQLRVAKTIAMFVTPYKVRLSVRDAPIPSRR
jgi:hypothetical protein